uniref:Uncharacterized protein n=1 Tax=Oryza punctata TaxID=4537 RepID=A0A0E0M7Q6_ORYPU
MARGGGDAGNPSKATMTVKPPTMSFDLDDSPLAAASSCHNMVTLGGLVRGRGDPSFSLTLSLANPTVASDVELLLDGRAVTRRSRGGHALKATLTREGGKITSESLAHRTSNGDTCRCRFPPGALFE